LRVHDARELAALAAQPPTPSRGTNLNLSSPHHQCRTRLPTTPTGESPNNRQTATCWTSGWSSDGQRPRPRCPGMRSPPALQAHKLNDGGQRPANGPGQTDRHHRSATDGQTASLHGMGSPSSRTGPERDDGQHFRWSEPMWSPPPESNRRPHPYHSCGPPPIESAAQVTVTRVTMNDRQAPPEPARYGTGMARRPVSLNDARVLR
jgi:hypothetical protein